MEEMGPPEAFALVIAKYRSGDAWGAVDSFMALVGGPDWRAEVQRTVPDGPEQAVRDAATFFDVELPALRAWILSKEKASRISQPVLYVLGVESGAHFDRPKEVFQSTVKQTEEVLLAGMNHLLMMRNPGMVAKPIGDFLARHPL
jgi:hypothetical protein